MQFSGAVLAGGHSRRFGQNKARYMLGGRPLLGWVLDSLEDASQRYIVANQDYSDFGVPTYTDLIPGGDVMSGLHTALVQAQHDWVAVAGCDQPFLTKAYWSFMLAQIRPDSLAVAALSAEGLAEPLGALYHQSLEPDLRKRLEKGHFKLQRLLAEVKAHMVRVDELTQRFGWQLFINANSIEDLALCELPRELR